MSYDAPTASSIKARFPEFASLADARIEALIAEGASYVSESWIETDYTIAYNYVVAHLLLREGALDASGSVVSQSGPVQSESLGDASVTYAGVRSNGLGDDMMFSTTEYGRRYLSLKKKNFGTGAMIV